MPALRVAPGLALTGIVVALAYGVHARVPAVSPLSLSVLLGIIVVNAGLVRTPSDAGIAFAGHRVMRLGVALLGMELSLASIRALGATTLVAVAAVVAATILGVTLLARALGLPTDFGLLIGVGYGICGASAIAAARPQTRTTEEQASYAVALVALCGTLSIGVLPLVSGLLGLTDLEFGRWAGAAVHDVGQVVATASTRDAVALQAAVVVKLARVALLAPVVLMLALRHRRRHAGTPHVGRRVAPVPLFVAAFLVLAALHSLGVVPAAAVAAIVTASKIAMAFGLAALGLRVRWQDLRALGGRPLVLGLLAWALVASVAYFAVAITGGAVATAA